MDPHFEVSDLQFSHGRLGTEVVMDLAICSVLAVLLMTYHKFASLLKHDIFLRSEILPVGELGENVLCMNTMVHLILIGSILY